MRPSSAPMPGDFHPATRDWFLATFPGPTVAQRAAWPAIQAGRDTLVAAPTGSGKTLTAFLAAIDALVREGLGADGLPDTTTVVYVSPLKALSNDIRLNLEGPLAGIRARLSAAGLPEVDIRTAVRTGDTPARERAQALRRPPHILVTTPESLYVLLGSASGRRMLGGVRTVIVDEIHALAAGKRGSHLALTLERLQSLCDESGTRRFTRIGLSATQKPIEAIARFLVGVAAGADADADADVDVDAGVDASASASVGTAVAVDVDAGANDGVGADAEAVAPREAAARRRPCEIVDVGHARARDLALELPPTPLGAVMSNEQWEQVHGRLAELARLHRTTLVFVNTRRMAERTARHLGERLGREAVAAHHGSLSKETRLDAEQRLKRGELQVLVATASLELGLDIGDVDLVCQLGSPRSIATFLQRVGRSGHAVDGTPKARLFAQSRDELVECAALLDCVRRGELDALRIPSAPLDVLAQQIVAETACREWGEDELFALVRRAAPYARLTRPTFDAVVRMVSEGYAGRNGPRAGQVHRDAVNHRLRERRGSRLTALTSGGTIPETGDYSVLLQPQADAIGTVHEDFAVESMAGDVFQLGNTSYRILKIEPGRVRVEDAKGAPPNIPFWLGEAPGRSDELSFGVARLRQAVGERLRLAAGDRPDANDAPAVDASAALAWLMDDVGLDAEAARQIVEHLARAAAALGRLPTQDHVVIERFFDASGGMQLVIHAPFGSRINRAWGLALRKRFCRSFNFELQAAATEDAIVLSLSTSHSFELAGVARYLHSASALDVLVQALLDAPLFGVRWRWNAANALALPRFAGGRKVAPQLQRMRSEDLLAAVFPDQVACAENLVGDRSVPEHPLVAQTLDDCLHDAMDAEGWLRVLRRIEAGEVSVTACDLPAPSALAAEALSARPYAFLDDAPLEERRSRAVRDRGFGDTDGADDLGRLDPGAIEAVRAEAWPAPRSADEMHEALVALGTVTDSEARREARWLPWLGALAEAGRATRLSSAAGGVGLWVAAERLLQAVAVHPLAALEPPIDAPVDGAAPPADRGEALRELLRGRLGGLGPATVDTLAAGLQVPASDLAAPLLQLQAEGHVLQGRFSPQAGTDEAPIEWCERHLLARIHRYTLGNLRREIEPVEPRDFARFLFDWQRVSAAEQAAGPEALAAVLAQLEGFEAPAALWEAELLPARVSDYQPAWLDQLCTSGRTLWTRLRPGAAHAHAPASASASASASRGSRGRGGSGSGNGSLRATPILLLPRRGLALWTSLAPAAAQDDPDALGGRARRVADHLALHGASFFDEITQGTRLLQSELEEALAELVQKGRAHCDSYAGLRALLVPPSRRGSVQGPRGRRGPMHGIAEAGRWSLIRPAPRLATDGVTAVPATPAASAAEAVQTSMAAKAAKAAKAARVAPFGPAGPAGASGASGASKPAPESLEQLVHLLLKRYGVLCWQLLDREPAWLPPWRDLVRVCRRLEARGEIRGGRFIAGVSGEQFALPDAIALMRQVRRRPPDGAWVVLAASDPANLLGTVLSGAKLPRIAGARVLLRDGVPVATRIGDEVSWLEPVAEAERAAALRLLASGTISQTERLAASLARSLHAA